jgi:dihydrofolate reductase
MRTISSFINVTLDGYFEGPNHDISFFKGDDEDNSYFREQSSSRSAILMGHRTYDMMKRFWPTEQAKKENPEVAKYMNEAPKIVVARRPFEPGWHNVTVVSGDVVGKIGKIKEQSGGPIVTLGSNALCVSLLEEGLIDEVRVMVNPIALGDGTPLFTGLSESSRLTLADTRPFKSGKVLLTYKPDAARRTSPEAHAAAGARG